MSKQQKKPPVKTIPAPTPAKPKPAGPKKESQASKFSLPVKLALLLGVIAFLVYANTLKNGYALDDFNVIKDNTIVTRGASAIPEIFATPYRRGWFVTTNDLYRPLSLAMFAAEYQAADGSPALGHFMNIILFAGCVILLFLFLERFFEGRKTAVAFIAALLFALHPIHTEVVANIKSRDEILCFFFAFFSMNLFLKYMDSGKMKHLLSGSLCFFLSLMSKETVITFLGIIPLVFFFYRNEHRKRGINITAGAVIMAALFLAIRFSVLSAYHANNTSDVSFIDNMLAGAPSAASRLATELGILGNYIKLLVIPYPLICDYSYNSIPFTTFGNPWVLISLAAYLFLGIFSIYRLMKNHKDAIAFSILFYLAAISLFSNIPFLIGTPMAERFLFFGSVGFCLFLALAAEKWLLKTETAGFSAVKSTRVLAIVVPLSLLYGFTTINRNSDWENNLTLFKADVPKSPNDARLAYYYGTEIVTTAMHEGNPVEKKRMVEEGIPYLRKSLAIYPDYENALSELGNAFFHHNENDSAEIYDKKALALNPNSSLTLNNLAGVYFVTHKYPLALEICRKSIELNPKYVDAYSNMGLCFLNMGLVDSSLHYLYTAISINANFKGAYENLVLVYRRLNNADSVKKYEAMAKAK